MKLTYVATVVAVVALSGCGSGVEDAKVPTTHVGPSVSAADSDYDKAVRFTRCMNDNVPEGGQKIPDPVEGKPLQTWVTVPFDRTASGAGAAVMGVDGGGFMMTVPGVFEKCKHLLPATWPVKQDPADTLRSRPFAECMRKRGINMPEPDANGMVRYPADPSYQSTPQFEGAVEACRYLYDDPANHQADQ